MSRVLTGRITGASQKVQCHTEDGSQKVPGQEDAFISHARHEGHDSNTEASTWVLQSTGSWEAQGPLGERR